MGQGKDSTKKAGWKQLTEKERYKIEALFQRGLTPSEISKEIKRDRRTVEREIAQGLTLQRDYEYRERMVYLADVGQRVHDEKASNKGRELKIGHDHELAKYIEDKIMNDRWSPDAVIGNIKAEGLQFKTSICTKTLYNYIDGEVFAGISNKDLWVKKSGKKRALRT